VTIEEEIGRILTEKSMTIATAESCTGGLISHRITNVPGSSAYFLAGFVTYSNDAKERDLSVPRDVLVKHGAVSTEVARRMAEGVRKVAAADLGLAVTGIAGPTGGTADKPVGTVVICLTGPKKVIVRQCLFRGARLEIKTQTSEEALGLVVEYFRELGR
jgi:PncC family amidohydrolase